MQLDHTELVIRQRTALELFDLTLVVLRRHFRLILLASAMLGIPLGMLNVALTSWMLSEESLLVAEQWGDALSTARWRHNSHLAALTFLEFPIASLPITLLLGHLVFRERISLREVAKLLYQLKHRWLLVLGGLRCGLIGLLLELFVNRDVVFDYAAEFVLFLIAGVMLLIRASMPFAPEIIALERCPLRVSHRSQITYWKRNASLHHFMAGDNVGRYLTLMIVILLLGLSLHGNAIFIQGTLTGFWEWNWVWDYVVFPALLWSLGCFAGVFRFLAYLDTRIRSEGWEVELMTRAEAARQIEQESGPQSGLRPSEAGVAT